MAEKNDWIGAMFVGLGLGAAGVAGALAWVSSTIGPASIPIWMFVVGGATYVFRGPLGNALAQRISGTRDADGDNEQLHAMYGELDDMRVRMAELEERVDFSERVLSVRDTQQQVDTPPALSS